MLSKGIVTVEAKKPNISKNKIKKIKKSLKNHKILSKNRIDIYSRIQHTGNRSKMYDPCHLESKA